MKRSEKFVANKTKMNERKRKKGCCCLTLAFKERTEEKKKLQEGRTDKKSTNSMHYHTINNSDVNPPLFWL